MYYIYGKDGCGYCSKAKQLATEKGLEWEYIDLTHFPLVIEEFREKGLRTIPQVFYGNPYRTGEYIGGYEEMVKHVGE